MWYQYVKTKTQTMNHDIINAILNAQYETQTTVEYILGLICAMLFFQLSYYIVLTINRYNENQNES